MRRFLRWSLLLVLLVCGLVISMKPAMAQETNGSADTNARKAGERLVKTVDGIEYAFRWCPAGKFFMGSPNSEKVRKRNETRHEVTLSHGFWMLETEVTQAMWKSLMFERVSDKASLGTFDHEVNSEGPVFPMYYVNWTECQEFCRRLSNKLGMKITLPTEAQWEYACRAGTTGRFAGDLDAMAWYLDNSEQRTHAVAQKQPNAWGLYDMHGNVDEWCQDWYRESLSDSVTDPAGAETGYFRVARGGSWCLGPLYSRSAGRSCFVPDYRSYSLGFRVVSSTP